MSDELVAQLALELIPGVGSKGIKQLTSYCGSASSVFKTPKSKLLKVPGVGETMANLVLTYRPFSEAETIIKAGEKQGIDILHYTNSRYPNRLKQILDAPNILYFKGNGDLNPKKSIAVVGTRKTSEYGRRITDQLISDLSAFDVTVTSGLAYGIDIQAHRAALKHKIPTLAVLAGGLDRLYPSTHKKYAEEMCMNGGILSESIPGTKPDPHLFPARNRIIAGMTDATIVVEAAEKGGALITAHQADSYDRVVFAVPGNIGSEYSIGTNRLIASQKALIYTGIQDLIYHLGWELEGPKPSSRELPDLSNDEQIIYETLQAKNEAMEIDIIALQSQLSINQVASNLLSLEFKNLVKSLPGKKYGLIYN